MKLSDAMVLGSTLREMWKDWPALKGVCAMQAAAIAANGNTGDWITGLPNFDNMRLSLPCSCDGHEEMPTMMDWLRFDPANPMMYWSKAIIHMFNFHVVYRKDWTFEQLVAWVRSVEPAGEFGVTMVHDEVIVTAEPEYATVT